MRELNIAYGNNRQAKRWVNKTIGFDDLKERLRVTIRTTESAEEYAKMSRAQRDTAKDHGGFVAGVLKGGRRKADTVESRSMVALDGDRINADFLESYESLCPYTSVLYTTHSSTEENPRVRLVFPLTRDVTPEEFVAVSRYLAQMLGIDYFDECSYQPNQLMYWPSTPANGSFVYKETDGPWLDPDTILSEHPEWTDPTRLPTSSRESKANTTAQQKVQEPLTKEGVVGLFNRTYYPISKALEAFLSDVYEPTDNESRWHLIASSSMAGVEIKEDKFVYSHHAKDPAYLKMCNAFDIIRIHRFGDLDDKASYKAMCEFAMEQDEVKMLAASERTAGAETDFSGGEDIDWQKHLQYEPRSMVLKNNLHNITLIMENDPNLKGIVFNQLADGLEIKGEVPWKHPARFWRDADDAQLISFVDSHYGSFSERNYRIAVTKVTDDRSYHPIREMFESLPPWDKVRRAETVLIDYLGAEDNRYVRAVTRKSLCAAYMRVHYPGIKFDNMIVLNGAQGIGKSTLISSLGGEWFSDSLALSDMNDKTAAEKLQGYWILEIGELAGMRKADIDKVKAYFQAGRQIPCQFWAEGDSAPKAMRVLRHDQQRERVSPRHYRQPQVLERQGYRPGKVQALGDDRRGGSADMGGGRRDRQEKLYLDADLEAYARQEQREAMEQDDREGIVRNYLDMLLPDDWDSMDYYRRREYIRDIDDPTRVEGTVKRQTVSNIEIWCECFGKSKEEMRPSDSYAISAIMVRIEGWEKCGVRQMLPIYGRQRVYTRTT